MHKLLLQCFSPQLPDWNFLGHSSINLEDRTALVNIRSALSLKRSQFDTATGIWQEKIHAAGGSITDEFNAFGGLEAQVKSGNLLQYETRKTLTEAETSPDIVTFFACCSDNGFCITFYVASYMNKVPC